jgi:O-antigen/teichoic acid export membrane protein
VSMTESENGTGPLAALKTLASRVLPQDAAHASVQKVAGFAFLVRVASAAISYASQVFMARWMGDTQFGIYIYVWVYVLLIGHIANLGLVTTAQKFIPHYAETQETDLLRGFLRGARLMGFVSGTAVGALGLVGLWLFGEHLNHSTLVPFYLAAFCLPLYVLTDIQDGIGRSYDWTDIGLGGPYILRPLLILGSMILAWALGFAADSVTAMACALVATWCTGLVQALVLNVRLRQRTGQGPRRYAYGEWLRVSLPILLVEGFYLLLTYADIMVLERYVTPADVAIYWAAVKTLALVAFVYFSVSAATAHRFSEYYSTGSREKLTALLSQAMRWTFLPSALAVLGLVVFGKPLLWLFGPQYDAGYIYILVLSAGVLARAAVGPSEKFLSMQGEQRICALIYAIALSSNVGLCIILIPRFGPLGAALATACALWIESLSLFSVIRFKLGYRVSLWGRAE